MSSTVTTPIDVREIPPHERHKLIFGRFDALVAGEALELLSDHEPVPLHRQFKERCAGRFDWSVLQAGPDQWHVRIGKLRAVPLAVEADSCCSGGACGG